MLDYDLTRAEQVRRTDLAQKARRMILSHMKVEAEDETSLTLDHRGYYMQISFSPLHPLLVVCLAAGSSAGGLLCRAAPQARRRAVLARAARAVCNVLHPDDQLRLPDERAAGENGYRPHGHARAQDAGRLSRPA